MILDAQALSDQVALAVGPEVLPEEGLTISLTRAPSNIVKIDADQDGVLQPREISSAGTAVIGVDQVITGKANDRLVLGSTQVTRATEVDLGAQQHNERPGALMEGFDLVTYQHGDLTNDGLVTAEDVPRRPTLVVALDASGTVRVHMSAGALEGWSVTDSLRGVERLDLSDAATSDRQDDLLDLRGLAGGAVVNFGAAVTLGASLGGVAIPANVAQLDAASLDAGGVADSSGPLGLELLTLLGLQLVERVQGSDADDRLILASELVLQSLGTGAFAATESPRPTHHDASNAEPGGLRADRSDWMDQRLYQFDLGAGTADTLDYRQSITGVAVSVGTAAKEEDLVFVGAPASGRIDLARGVERYFGSGVGQNWIDLAAASTATTIRFSADWGDVESGEPDGFNGSSGAGMTRCIEVRGSEDGLLFASFIDRTGTGPYPAALWLNLQGSVWAETVQFGDADSAAAHHLYLGGGANRVDYSALTAPITAELGAVDVLTVALPQFSLVQADTLQQLHGSRLGSEHLSLLASRLGGDVLDIRALVLGSVVRAHPSLPTNSQVDPQFHLVDLGANRVTESLLGEFLPVDGGAVQARAFVTEVLNFEAVSNAGDPDAVHLLGSGGGDGLVGGSAADLIIGGLGGDSLTGGAAGDRFLYRGERESPGGSLAGGDQAPQHFASELALIEGRDRVLDFATGSDRLLFALADQADSLRVDGALPANLSGNLNAAVALTAVFAAGDLQLNIGLDAGAASSAARLDNYRIATPGVMLSWGELSLRVAASAGADLIDASAGLALGPLNAAASDGLCVELVYSGASQSQAASFDQILHFSSGSDRIDLSFLRLARYESSHQSTGINYDTNGNNIVDALESGVLRVLGVAPAVAINAALPGLFLDGGGIYRPVVAQTMAVDGGVSTTLFIDADGDGHYQPDRDMVLVLVGSDAPAAGDFVFDQYGGGWGV